MIDHKNKHFKFKAEVVGQKCFVIFSKICKKTQTINSFFTKFAALGLKKWTLYYPNFANFFRKAIPKFAFQAKTSEKNRVGT